MTGIITSKRQEQKVAEIAARDLGIDNLKTRNLDSLDFHEVAVWQVKAALRRAYEEGQRSITGE